MRLDHILSYVSQLRVLLVTTVLNNIIPRTTFLSPRWSPELSRPKFFMHLPRNPHIVRSSPIRIVGLEAKVCTYDVPYTTQEYQPLKTRHSLIKVGRGYFK